LPTGLSVTYLSSPHGGLGCKLLPKAPYLISLPYSILARIFKFSNSFYKVKFFNVNMCFSFAIVQFLNLNSRALNNDGYFADNLQKSEITNRLEKIKELHVIPSLLQTLQRRNNLTGNVKITVNEIISTLYGIFVNFTLSNSVRKACCLQCESVKFN
jgi:hypothetical protein